MTVVAADSAERATPRAKARGVAKRAAATSLALAGLDQ